MNATTLKGQHKFSKKIKFVRKLNRVNLDKKSTSKAFYKKWRFDVKRLKQKTTCRHAKNLDLVDRAVVSANRADNAVF